MNKKYESIAFSLKKLEELRMRNNQLLNQVILGLEERDYYLDFLKRLVKKSDTERDRLEANDRLREFCIKNGVIWEDNKEEIIRYAERIMLGNPCMKK